MSAAEDRRWKVGELAKATGLTVRALHHYDEVALLVPSERTSVGHRLYSERDVRRLYRILALRRLGLGLEQIASVLDEDGVSLLDTVRRHLAQVERELEHKHRLRERLRQLLHALERSVEPAAQEFIDTMEELQMDSSELVLDADLRTEIIESALRSLSERYVFPDVAPKIEAAVRKRLDEGEYDAITSGADLSELLTSHLREASDDKTLRVFYRQGAPGAEMSIPEKFEHRDRTGGLTNFGFARVERLPGNVGYLELHSFFPADAPGASETAFFALGFLVNTSALIIDLRKNGGGHPNMIALLSSYLVDEPVHLTSHYGRDDEVVYECRTSAFVPGKGYGDKPVFVLTSSRTGGAAVDFTYALKSLGRAKSVGETVFAMARPGAAVSLTPHFDARIPTARVVSPITGTNWEDAGVMPDLEVPAERALVAAHRAALKLVIDDVANHPRPHPGLLEEARTELARLEEPAD